MSEYSKGDRVEENTSALGGEVVKVMEDDGGKKYRIEWDDGNRGIRRGHQIQSE